MPDRQLGLFYFFFFCLFLLFNEKYIFFSYLYLLGLISASTLLISFLHHSEKVLQSATTEVTTDLRHLSLTTKEVLLNSQQAIELDTDLASLKVLPLISLFLSFFIDAQAQ